jgi:tetratricopeptide (TPR) repeat protein
MKNKNIGISIILISLIVLLGGCGIKTSGNYYKEGLKFFNSGNYKEAETNFTKAIEINSERAEYYIDYGMTLIMLEEYDEAIEVFDQAILDKNNAIVNKNNKKALRGKGIAYFESFQYTKAIEQFDKALAITELSEINLDIRYYLGSSQEKAGLYENAVETYSLILNKSPSDAAIYSSRAFAYRKLGDYDKSLADYDKAISFDTTNYDYYFGKYFLMIEFSEADAATLVMNEASKLSVETQEDKFNLAKVHFYNEDYDTAIIEFSEAFRNGFTAAYVFLGDIYMKESDYESAVYNYLMYSDDEANEKSATVYNQIGVCYIKLEKYEEALTYIQLGLEYNDISLNQELKQNEIVAYENLGEYEEAYQCMTEYLTLYPDDEEASKEYEFIKTRLPDVSTITTKTEE